MVVGSVVAGLAAKCRLEIVSKTSEPETERRKCSSLTNYHNLRLFKLMLGELSIIFPDPQINNARHPLQHIHCTSDQEEPLVAVEPRRPPIAMTNVDTETAFRHDQCKHFHKKVIIS